MYQFIFYNITEYLHDQNKSACLNEKFKTGRVKEMNMMRTSSSDLISLFQTRQYLPIEHEENETIPAYRACFSLI